MKLLIASNNAGKVKEIKAILGPFYPEIYTPREIGLDLDVVEDGQTFEELYQRAAQFMYKAKQNGKQQYCFGGQLYRFNALADGVSKDEDKQ